MARSERFSTISTKTHPRAPPFDPLWAHGRSSCPLHANSQQFWSNLEALLEVHPGSLLFVFDWPKGVKGEVLRRSPEGFFGRNRRKLFETAQPMCQKAIQGLLSRFRWSPTTFHFRQIFGRFERGSFSTCFQNRTSTFQTITFPRQEPWGCIPRLSNMEKTD